ISGKIRVGDEITIYPQGVSTRISGLQVHNKEENDVSAGLRTAVNLQGIEKAVIRRGDVLATKDSLRPTYMVDVDLDLLSSAPRKLKNRARVRFHSGTSEIMARVVLLERDEMKPGESCFAQIRLDEPTAVLRGDRYVLRSYSPVRAIGGGEVLNALPGRKKKRFSDAVLAEMKSLQSGELNTGKKKLDEVLKKLMAQKKLAQYDKERGALIHADFLQKAKDEIIDTLSRYHKDYPLKTGLLKEELRSRTTGSRIQKLFNHLINLLSQEGVVVQEKEIVRLKEHQVTLAQDQKEIRQKLEKIYSESRLQPPYIKEWRNEFPGDSGPEVLEVMAKEGALLKVTEELYFHRDAIEELEGRLVDFLKKNGEITTPQFKELTGTSRKYAIPLVEYYDRNQVTVRVGDSRVLRKK
ncbi:MAG: SelB C-terminal domain-containing protein, partial [Deltaproteobacteria bacterium]|nr:SelB C-terminal domain-containing protein [Deltaproteobacteria bacterium]